MKKYLIVIMFSFLGSFAQKMAQYDIQWGVKAITRDGIRLNATIYKPTNLSEKLPVILDVTPYISDTYHERGRYFAENGYIYAIIDCRGRGSSEGVFNPFMQEANDGYDLVEWFAKQPYCNGKIAMWGGSYSGHNQWATAKTLPPHLTTIVPVASVYPGNDFPMTGNIFSSYTISWLTYTSGKTGNRNLFSESPYWQAKYADLYKKHLPFTQLDKIAGNETTVFQTWLSHPSYDDYWKSMSPQKEDFSKMNFPILTITGQYDADQLGAMTFYKNFMKYASPEAQRNKYLIIGPWDHPGTRTPKLEIGGLKFGLASLLDLNKLHKEWYDFATKNAKKPTFLKKNVAYYVVGEEKWKYANSLAEVTKEKRILYLDNINTENTVFQSGILSEIKPAKDGFDKIVYDPLNNKTGLANLTQEDDEAYYKNQFEVINAGEESVIYHSNVFKDSTEISGFLEANLYISSNVPDTDIKAQLYEITDNGESIYLTGAMLRLRYRESPEKEVLMQPDKIYPVNLTDFDFISKKIPAGSRLRFVVGAINSIGLEKNYNSGGIVAAESSKDAKKALIKIYHEKNYQSQILLPIGKE